MRTKFILFVCFILIIQSAAKVERLDKEQDCKCRLPANRRVVNGSVVEHPIPWIVSIQINNGDFTEFGHKCGGVIVNKHYVMTLASCVYKYRNDQDKLKIRMGINKLSEASEILFTTKYVKKIHIDPSYKPNSAYYIGHLAFLEIDNSIILSNKVQPACFNLNEDFNSYKNDLFDSAGWGSVLKVSKAYGDWTTPILSNDLKHAYYKYEKGNSIEFLYFDECRSEKGNLLCLSPVKEHNGMCFGDFGSPLSSDKQGYTRVLGLTAFVTSKLDDNSREIFCNGHAVFSKLSSHMLYFNEIIGDDYCTKKFDF